MLRDRRKGTILFGDLAHECYFVLGVGVESVDTDYRCNAALFDRFDVGYEIFAAFFDQFEVLGCVLFGHGVSRALRSGRRRASSGRG